MNSLLFLINRSFLLAAMSINSRLLIKILFSIACSVGVVSDKQGHGVVFALWSFSEDLADSPNARKMYKNCSWSRVCSFVLSETTDVVYLI